jgi:hypothetical protein
MKRFARYPCDDSGQIFGRVPFKMDAHFLFPRDQFTKNLLDLLPVTDLGPIVAGFHLLPPLFPALAPTDYHSWAEKPKANRRRKEHFWKRLTALIRNGKDF